jgi:AcrR family transcriptional regulator
MLARTVFAKQVSFANRAPGATNARLVCASRAASGPDAREGPGAARVGRTRTVQTVFALHGAFAYARSGDAVRVTRDREEPPVPSEVEPRVPPGGLNRRERLRRQTFGELEVAALAEVREHGPVALSLRRVARRMGMSPAGLYRYVDSREALLTLLITRAYDDLADHLCRAIGLPPGSLAGPTPPHAPDGAPDGAPVDVLGDASAEASAASAAAPLPLVAGPDTDVAERLRAVALAYRAWSVAHPNEFGLIFGDPIPDYEAPAGGPTVAAMTRVGLALATPLIEAWHLGRLRVHPALEAAELTGPLAEMAKVGGDLPPAAHALLLLTWGRLHGQVSLEVFGHHHWLFPDGCEALYRAEIASMLTDLGVTDRPT